MKKAILVVFLLILSGLAVNAVGAKPEERFVSNEFIVGFENLNSEVIFDIENSGGVVLEQVPTLGALRVHVPSAGEHAFVASAWRISGVRYVERNGIFSAVYTPNDPYWSDLWGMQIIQADYA